MNTESTAHEIGAGQYDDAYAQCNLLWGKHPASNVIKASSFFDDMSQKTALDLGCGEGKNSIFLASKGFQVKSIDISEIAIEKAKRIWQNWQKIDWQTADIRNFSQQNPQQYHVVLLTGPLHCFSSKNDVIHTIENAKSLTKIGGINVISVFNSREQDFSGHSKLFKPLLLPHEFYTQCYLNNWEIIEESDTDLADCHPHNNIPHKHSITRIIARRIT